MSDGQGPQSGLAVDSTGRLLGATPSGGTSNAGLVFRLSSPVVAGSLWTEEVLFNLADAGNLTAEPYGPVVVGSDGTVFATAAGGGKGDGGTAFRLDEAAGEWTYTALHNFTGGYDGRDTFPGLVLGPSGLLYGSTVLGGKFNLGTEYSISPLGGRTEFGVQPVGSSTQGYLAPSRPAAVGSDRLVYTTSNGGAAGAGAVYSALQTAPGHWRTTLIYSFGPSGDAKNPAPDSPLDPGPGRVLNGCADGGKFDAGAVYQLIPPASGSTDWHENVLYSFGAQTNDPVSSAGRCYVVAGESGTLIGVTTEGGKHGNGAIFKLTPPSLTGAAWTETLLFNFNARNSGLYFPQGVPVRIGATIYGTAMFGGASGSGGVWAFSP